MNKNERSEPTSKSIAPWVSRLAEGDPAAIEWLYRTYFHRLLYLGIQVAGSEHRELVEDVIQEFFVWLADEADLKGIRNFETYMFQVVRRNINRRISADKRSIESFKRYSHQTGLTDSLETPSAEQTMITEEERLAQGRMIEQALNELPAYQREVLYLRYFENKSYEEIAEILSVNRQVTYNYASRALKRLKEMLPIALILIFGG